MEKLTFTREELYELVWKESMLSLSKIYEISDVGLRKACIRMSIPTPPAGYWMKLQSGKKAAKMRLPVKYEGKNEIILEVRRPKIASEKSGPSYGEILQELNSNSKLDFRIPGELKNPDKLVVAARQKLRDRSRSSSQYIGAKISRGDTLDIRVSLQNITRSLRFMDALIKMLRKLGHDVIIGRDHFEQGTFAQVNGQLIRIYLRDKLKRVVTNNGRWNTTELHTSGILFFNIGGTYGKAYTDGKKTIEEQMPDILAKLILKSHAAIQAQKERDEWHAEYEKKEKARKELEERKHFELKDFVDLLGRFSRWQQSRQIREYLVELEKLAIQNDRYSDEFKIWLERARDKTDWFDPMIEKEDPWLEGVDRNNIYKSVNKSSEY